MQFVTADFLSALRGPHTVEVRAELWRVVPPATLPTRVDVTLQVLSGEVSTEASRTAAPRRSMSSLELAPKPNLWTELTTPGSLIKAWRGIRFPNGVVERVPLGVFDIDEVNADAGPGGGYSLTCPDVWNRVSRARFEKPRATPTGSAHDQAVTLAVEAIGLGTGLLNGDTTLVSKSAVWERDRNEAVEELTRRAGSWIYTDTAGQVASRRVPRLGETPVWTIDASATGVLLSAGRTRSRQRTYNVVVVVPADTDGTAPFAPVTVADTDVNSPTSVDKIGRVPYFYSAQGITTTAQAQTAAKALLRRVTGLAAQLDITSVVNPALEPGDVIQVLLPAREGERAKVERHIIDAVNVPLTVDGTQTIRTRSSRPEGDVPEDA